MGLIRSLIILLLLSIIYKPLYSYPLYNSAEEMTKNMMNLEIEASSAKRVQGHLLELCYGELTLEDGTYYNLKPVNGRVCAGLYVGSGSFDFQIPELPEIYALKTKFKTERISTQIEWVFIFSGDSLAQNLGNDYQKDEKPNSTENYIMYFRDYISSFNKKMVNSDVGSIMLNGDNNDFKMIIIKTKDHLDPLIYMFDPDNREEVKLLRGRGHTLGDYMEVLCSYFKPDYVPQKDNILNDKDYLKINKYDINLDFDKSLNMTFDITMDITTLRPTKKWFGFYIFNKCNIKEITLNGEKCSFYNDEKSSLVYINFNNTFKAGEKLKLNIKYSGDITNKMDGITYLKELSTWYPRYGYETNAIFDVKAKHYEGKDKFTATGNEVEHKVVDGIVNTRWLTPAPVKYCTYSIATYDELNKITPSGDTLSFHYRISTPDKEYISHVTNSFEFCKQLFGALPIKKFTVTSMSNPEIFGYRGEIVTSNLDIFESTKIADLMYIPFFVSLQWFPVNSDVNSYRDLWVQFGINLYSTVLYTQVISGNDQAPYIKLLEKLNKELMKQQNNDNGQFAPIAALSGRYATIIKSAMIFHMLRQILTDSKLLVEMNPNKDLLFVDIIQTFYKRFKDKKYSERDFQAIVEEKTGMDFSWFFSEWVNTTCIPTYKYAYKIDEVNGKYVVKFKVKQSNVPQEFQMVVPVLLTVDDKPIYHFKSIISGDKTVEFSLPPQDKKPDDIIFNPEYSVLCEHDKVSWDDL